MEIDLEDISLVELDKACRISVDHQMLRPGFKYYESKNWWACSECGKQTIQHIQECDICLELKMPHKPPNDNGIYICEDCEKDV